MGFVNRATVSLNQKELAVYYKRYLTNVYPTIYLTKGEPKKTDLLLKHRAGEPCNVQATQEMKRIWDFYAALTPSVIKNELDVKLSEMETLVGKKENFCKVYWSFDSEGNPLPALTCSSGTCVDANDPSTKPFAEKVQKLAESMMTTKQEEKEQNQVYENLPSWEKDPACTEFEIGKPCLTDKYLMHLCFKDYRDPGDGSVYDADCNLLKEPDPTPMCRHIVHDPDKNCEEVQLKRMLTELVSGVGTLKRGDRCDYDMEEKDVRKLIKGDFGGRYDMDDWGNLYKLYSRLKRVHNFNYCDRTRLLTCGRCECQEGTAPRSVFVDGKNYESDHCYANSGSCNNVMRGWDNDCNEKEKEGIRAHYGTPDANCEGGNLCMFVDKERNQCTPLNTGNTGYDGTLPWPPGPTTSPSQGGGGLGGFNPPTSGGKNKMESSLATIIFTFLVIANCC